MAEHRRGLFSDWMMDGYLDGHHSEHLDELLLIPSDTIIHPDAYTFTCSSLSAVDKSADASYSSRSCGVAQTITCWETLFLSARFREGEPRINDPTDGWNPNETGTGRWRNSETARQRLGAKRTNACDGQRAS